MEGIVPKRLKLSDYDQGVTLGTGKNYPSL